MSSGSSHDVEVVRVPRAGTVLDAEVHGPRGRPLVAFSHGGWMDRRMFDGQVESLVTIGAPCILPTSRGATARLRAVWRISGVVTGMLPLSLIRDKLPEGTATTPAAQEYVRGVTREITREDFGALVDVSREAGRGLEGKRIHVPVLATRGAQDVSGAGRLTAMTAATWPVDSSSFRYEEVPEAGHQAHQDNPEAFNRLLLDFLDGLPI